jgi:hypothetical protein
MHKHGPNWGSQQHYDLLQLTGIVYRESGQIRQQMLRARYCACTNFSDLSRHGSDEMCTEPGEYCNVPS